MTLQARYLIIFMSESASETHVCFHSTHLHVNSCKLVASITTHMHVFTQVYQGKHSYTRLFSTYPSLNVYSLHKSPLTCYKRKLHTLRNPMMYNLLKFYSEIAAKNLNKTYKIQCFHHQGLLSKIVEAGNGCNGCKQHQTSLYIWVGQLQPSSESRQLAY